MKKANRILTLLLAVMMVFSLACTIFAAESDTVPVTPITNVKGAIVIENPMDSVEYYAYKIFDVSYNKDKTAYTYTISESNPFFNAVDTYAKIEGNNIKLTETEGQPGTYVVVVTTPGFSEGAFSEAMQAVATKDNKTSNFEKITNGEGEAARTIAAARNLDLGYYLVVGFTNKENESGEIETVKTAIANLTTTNPEAVINDKNDVPFDKVANDKSVEVGQTVTFTITGKVPDYTGFTRYDYVVSDKMSKGLRFNPTSVEVKINGVKVELTNAAEKPVAGSETYTPANEIWYATEEDSTRDFIIGLNLMEKDADGKYVYAIGQDIEITYTATVTDDAVVVISENKATLDYSNDPSNPEGTGTREDEEKLYSAKIVIDKYDSETNVKLEGAKFVLYKDVTTTPETGEADESTAAPTTTRLYYHYDETAKEVKWVAEIGDATVVTTNNQGVAEFKGLEDGTYYLRETEAPAGYNLATNDTRVIIEKTNGDAALEATDEAAVATLLTNTAKVPNSTGPELPGTGGIGTTIFYIVGSILVAGAVVVLIAKKRMGAEK